MENKIDLVISDIASMPLKVAGNLNIPTILIGNFTWHDIYSHLPQTKNNSDLIEIHNRPESLVFLLKKN